MLWEGGRKRKGEGRERGEKQGGQRRERGKEDKMGKKELKNQNPSLLHC